MAAVRRGLTIEKKTKFYQELQILLADGTGKNLVGKKIACRIKESYSTEELLHDLTEANGGVNLIDDVTGTFALYIPADETDNDALTAVYEIIEINEEFVEEETEKAMYGKINYIKGV